MTIKFTDCLFYQMKTPISLFATFILSFSIFLSYSHASFVNEALIEKYEKQLRIVLGDDYDGFITSAGESKLVSSELVTIIMLISTTGIVDARSYYREYKRKQIAFEYADENQLTWCHEKTELRKWNDDINRYLADKYGNDILLCVYE